jgi:hypothetical protein
VLPGNSFQNQRNNREAADCIVYLRGSRSPDYRKSLPRPEPHCATWAATNELSCLVVDRDRVRPPWRGLSRPENPSRIAGGLRRAEPASARGWRAAGVATLKV